MKCKLFLALLLSSVLLALLLSACDMQDEEKELPGSTINQESNKEDPVQIGSGESQTKKDIVFDPTTPITEEELYSFELLRADWTDAQMLALGLKMEGDSGYRDYFNDSIMYRYGSMYGNDTTPDEVVVSGKLDVEGPRGISVGDTFKDVLNKFPQETDWQENSEGLFYGEPTSEVATGRVNYASGDRKKMVIWPDGGTPMLRIVFKNDVVESYSIILATEWDD